MIYSSDHELSYMPRAGAVHVASARQSLESLEKRIRSVQWLPCDGCTTGAGSREHKHLRRGAANVLVCTVTRLCCCARAASCAPHSEQLTFFSAWPARQSRASKVYHALCPFMVHYLCCCACMHCVHCVQNAQVCNSISACHQDIRAVLQVLSKQVCLRACVQGCTQPGVSH